MNKKRKITDGILNVLTYLFSSVGVIVLISIILFICKNGFKALSPKMVFGDYHSMVYTLKSEKIGELSFKDPNIEDSYFSKKWGIAIKDTLDNSNEEAILITYIDEASPFNYLIDTTTNEIFKVNKNLLIRKIILENDSGDYITCYTRQGSEKIVNLMDKGDIITDMSISTSGGGIRGSLITTIYLILLTLVIALPIGIIAAIYLAQYQKENKIKQILKTLIDMISGIPSIIFGLVGVIVFVPIVNNVCNTQGGSLMAGALTLAIMLLPVIIKTTEEAINVIPKHYRMASLALGASETQTTFKVILPNALPGILTATLLSIGRIIGESAALIYVTGTAIMDTVKVSGSSTSLALHIWSVMVGENPNIEQACAISIIILIVVLLLSILVKLIGKKLNKYGVK